MLQLFLAQISVVDILSNHWKGAKLSTRNGGQPDKTPVNKTLKKVLRVGVVKQAQSDGFVCMNKYITIRLLVTNKAKVGIYNIIYKRAHLIFLRS